MAQRAPLTITREEWREWDGEHGLSEWVDGEVVAFMPPKTLHEALVMWLGYIMGQFVQWSGAGFLVASPYEMRLPRSSRQPDLLFVSSANEGRIGPLRLEGPADLAVEVISDDGFPRDQFEKRREYEAAGVREYWIIDPRDGRRTCLALALGEDGSYAEIEPDADGRVHSRVIPGLWLDPGWFWQDPLPMTLRVLGAISPDLVRAMLEG